MQVKTTKRVPLERVLIDPEHDVYLTFAFMPVHMFKIDEHKPVRVLQIIDNDIPGHEIVVLEAATMQCHKMLNSSPV